MKRRKFCDYFNFFFFNCWYIPPILFFILLKICLISKIAENIQRQSNISKYEFKEEKIVFNKLQNSINQNYKFKSKFKNRKNENFKIEKIETGEIIPTHLNRTDENSIWLIYNRVPRCGGENIVSLLHKLGEENGFKHQEHDYQTPWPRLLLEMEQENLVTWFEYQHLPKSYDRHFYFVNFTNFQKYVKEKPIYINMVREPISRIKSFFLSKRANPQWAQFQIDKMNSQIPHSGNKWFHKSFEECVFNSDPECAFINKTKDFTLSIPFFCGQFNYCMEINNGWALQRAKFTIENNYSVVGVLERLNESLRIFENYIPKFFTGATNLYNEMALEDELDIPEVKSPVISNTIRRILEKKLRGEIELYKFINQRLDKQMKYLKN